MKMAVQYWINRGVRGAHPVRRLQGRLSRRHHRRHGGERYRRRHARAVRRPAAAAHHRRSAGRRGQDGGARNVCSPARADTIAGIIVEPLVQGAGGMMFHDADGSQAPARARRQIRPAADLRRDLHRLRPHRHHVRLRSGRRCARHHHAVESAHRRHACRWRRRWRQAKVFDAFWSDDPKKALMHGPTFMANALACAAANASLDLFEREPRLRTGGGDFGGARAAGLRRAAACRGVKDVRVKGAIGVVEMERIDDLEALRARFVEEGVFVRPFGNIIYLTPAFTIAPEDLEDVDRRGGESRARAVSGREGNHGGLQRTDDRHPPPHLAARRCAVAGRSADPAHVRRLFRAAARLSGRGIPAATCSRRASPNRCTSPPIGASTARSTRRSGCNRSPTATAFRTASSARSISPIRSSRPSSRRRSSFPMCAACGRCCIGTAIRCANRCRGRTSATPTEFRRGFALLEKYDLIFELQVYRRGRPTTRSS